MSRTKSIGNGRLTGFILQSPTMCNFMDRIVLSKGAASGKQKLKGSIDSLGGF